MVEAPFSEADYSSDYLDECHGSTSLDFNNDDLIDPIVPEENKIDIPMLALDQEMKA